MPDVSVKYNADGKKVVQIHSPAIRVLTRAKQIITAVAAHDEDKDEQVDTAIEIIDSVLADAEQ